MIASSSVMELILLTTITVGLLTFDPATSQQTISVINPPDNSTVLAGSSVLLDCGINGPYSGFFEWRTYKDSSVIGQQIYSSPPYTPNAKYPQTKFMKVGDYGLNVSSLEWTDGAKYICNFLSGDVHAVASLVVIDQVELSVSPSASDLLVNTTIRLECKVTFGGPVFDVASVNISDQFPHLEISSSGHKDMLLAPDSGATLNTTTTYHPGRPGDKVHTLIKTINYTPSMDDVDNLVICTVSTRKPQFTYSTNISLNVQAAAHDVTVDRLKWEHTVGDVINCSARGWPPPTYHWKPVSIPNNSTVVVQPVGPSLRITSSMIGPNVWKCVARTDTIAGSVPAELVVSFNVTDGNMKQFSDTSSDNGKTVGLAVGLVFGFLAIFAVAAAIIFLYIRRRNQQTRPVKKKAPPTAATSFNYSSLNPEADAFKPRPIYHPPPASTQLQDTSQGSADLTTNLVNRSGHGDLGLTFNQQDSTPAPQRTGSMSDPIASGSPLTDQFGSANQKPGTTSDWKPRDPPPPAPVRTQLSSNSTLDQSSLGFADLGFGNGLRASQHSINRAVDSSSSSVGRPATGRQATGALNGSLNQSMDSAGRQVAAGSRPSRVHGAVRDSNPSLNRSDDTAARLAGAPESLPPTGRMAGKPPKAQKKPDVMATAKPNDNGTVV